MGSGAIERADLDDCVLVPWDEIQGLWKTTRFTCEILLVKVELSKWLGLPESLLHTDTASSVGGNTARLRFIDRPNHSSNLSNL